MVAISSVIGKFCPRCQSPIQEGEPVRVCSECETPQHEKCWAQIEACSVYGCGSRQSELVEMIKERKNDDTKACPYCGETIKTVAIRCKHCHSNLPPPEFSYEETTTGPDSSGGLIVDAFNAALQGMSKHPGLLIGVHAFVGFTSLLFNRLTEGWGRGHHYHFSPGMLLVSILGTFFTVWLTIGVIKINLAIIDGRSAKFAELFSGLDRFGSFLGASLLSGLLVTFATLFFVIPGLILTVCLMFSTFFVVDQKWGAFAAIGKSFNLVRGSFWPIVGYLILALLLNLAGVLLFGVGLLLTVPLTSLGLAYIYRRLQQQPRGEE